MAFRPRWCVPAPMSARRRHRRSKNPRSCRRQNPRNSRTWPRCSMRPRPKPRNSPRLDVLSDRPVSANETGRPNPFAFKRHVMAEISASLVKDLREKTGAGMMDCKKALAETGGDIEAAVDWLRKKGLSAAAKKAGRVAAEGLVAVAASGTKGAVVEVNAETDFVSRNEQFQSFVRNAAQTALAKGDDIDALKVAPGPGGATLEQALTTLIATVGENMHLRR